MQATGGFTMSQRAEMQQLVALKRALEREMGIRIDMDRYGLRQRLLRLAVASHDPETAALVRELQGEATPADTPDDSRKPPARRIRGYYRGRPVYDD
jgi:hypothetical protein